MIIDDFDSIDSAFLITSEAIATIVAATNIIIQITNNASPSPFLKMNLKIKLIFKSLNLSRY